MVNTPDSAAREILVVEDEPAIAEICKRILSGEGLEVDIATNDKVAQDMIKRKQYDLCLIDIRTPGVSGKELYQWLQQEKPQLTRGVIFTTGDVMSGDTQAFLGRSGRVFLPKPFTSGELMTALKEAVRQIEK